MSHQKQDYESRFDSFAKSNYEYDSYYSFDSSDSSNSPRKLTFSTGTLLTENAKSPNFLINNILETDSHGILAGKSGAYKSFMALAIAQSICCGADFFGHRTFESHKVMYICGEGQQALGRRVRAINMVHGGLNDNFIALNEKIRIDNEDDIKSVNVYIQMIRPALVIFDTFSSMNSQTNENDNSDVSKALGMIHRNISNGFTSTMIVHHFGKDEEKGIRGASAFTANSDYVMLMDRDTESMRASLRSAKTKDGDCFQDIFVEARVVELEITQQDGSESTSLIIQKCEPYVNYKPGRKPKYYPIIESALHESMRDFPKIIDGKVLVNREDFRRIAKEFLEEQGVTGKNALNIISDCLCSMKKSGKLLENNNYLSFP